MNFKKKKIAWVVYLINDSFGFDGIVGVFTNKEMADRAMREFDDGHSVPTLHELSLDEAKVYL